MKIHTRGCFSTFTTQITDNVGIVGGVGIGIGLLEVGLESRYMLHVQKTWRCVTGVSEDVRE